MELPRFSVCGFLSQDPDLNILSYCETMKQLKGVVLAQRPGVLQEREILLHDTSRILILQTDSITSKISTGRFQNTLSTAELVPVTFT